MTRNIGNDGGGTHYSLDQECDYANLNHKKVKILPQLIEENIYCMNQIRKYLYKK